MNCNPSPPLLPSPLASESFPPRAPLCPLPQVGGRDPPAAGPGLWGGRKGRGAEGARGRRGTSSLKPGGRVHVEAQRGGGVEG